MCKWEGDIKRVKMCMYMYQLLTMKVITLDYKCILIKIKLKILKKNTLDSRSEKV